MDTFSLFEPSPTAFSGNAANPDNNSTFIERLGNPILKERGVHEEAGLPTVPGFSDVFDAFEASSRTIEGFSGGASAQKQAYAETIEKIKKRTGQELYNPRSPNVSAVEKFYSPDPSRPEFMPQEVIDARFVDKVKTLKQNFPDLLDDINPDDFAVAGRRVAQRAEAAMQVQNARLDVNPLVFGIAALAGGFWGTREDSLRLAANFVGGGAGTAASSMGRIAQVASTNFAAGFATTAIAQPFEQAWRETANLSPLTLTDMAENALFGGAANAGFAAGVQGLAEGVRAFKGWRNAPKADALIKDIEARGGFVAADTKIALRQAETVDALNHEFLSPPQGVPPRDAALTLEEGAQALLDPTAPRPLNSVRLSEAVDDTLALDLVQQNPNDLGRVLDGFRASSEARVSALASQTPDIAMLGHIATLEDAAFMRVRAGDVDILAAALVARSSSKEADQLALLDLIGRRQAKTPEEIRALIRDYWNVERVSAASETMMGRETVFAPQDAGTAPRTPPPLLENSTNTALDIPLPRKEGREVYAATDEKNMVLLSDGQMVSREIALQQAAGRDLYLRDLMSVCKE